MKQERETRNLDKPEETLIFPAGIDEETTNVGLGADRVLLRSGEEK